jgi:hypothetical protein
MAARKTGSLHSAAAKRRQSSPRGKAKAAKQEKLTHAEDTVRGGLRHADRAATVRKAFRNLEGRGAKITDSSIGHEYNRIVADRNKRGRAADLRRQAAARKKKKK